MFIAESNSNYDRISSPMIESMISGGSDDLYRPGQSPLARPYLYDPDSAKHSAEYMKHFYELNQAGKFGACWKCHRRFLDSIITNKYIHLPIEWKITHRNKNGLAPYCSILTCSFDSHQTECNSTN